MAADRAAGDQRRRTVAPVGLDPAFIGGVVFAIERDDADIHVVMRDDLADFGGHGADGRMKIKLPGQQSRNTEILVSRDVGA